jgi:hypothetical protein
MTILEYIPFIDNKVIWSIKDDFFRKFSFLIDKEISNKSPETIETTVIPNKEFEIKQIEDEQSRYEFEYWKKMEVIWHYSINEPLDERTASLKFDFWAIGYINVSSNYYSTELLDPNKFLLKKVQDLKLNSLKQLEIPSLVNYQSEYITDGFTNKFIDVCRKSKPLIPFKDFDFAYDLVYLSQDMCFILSELFLFKPYLRNFLEDPINTRNKTIYRYFPSFYDKQYFHLASNFLQTTYNFWDRIGDLLYHFFEFPKIKSDRDVYFDRIINQFPEESKNESYDFLLNFLQNEFKQFNKDRKQIVHYKGIEAQVFSSWIENSGRKDEIEKMQEWKIQLIDEYLELRGKSFKGIECALNLIENKKTVANNG